MRRMGVLKAGRPVAALVLGLALVLAVAGSAWAGIAGSAHDLSGIGGEDQICIFCHAPHNTLPSTSGPLWNHAASAAVYTVYSSATLDATVAQPGPESKACLSCHDGTVAIDSYGGATGSTFITGPALIGTDLSNDHPVGFAYDAALVSADGGLNSPAGLTGVELFADRVECATCHDVHDATIIPFLRTSNAASALCLECHNK